MNTAIQIEVLNAKANFYLPRDDDCADGKWRISPNNTPRDKLRGLINSLGLLQYVLAPILLIVSITQMKKYNDSNFKHKISIVCIIGSILCISLMIYRGYFSSLCT
jgi:hypothetical protein